MTPDKVSKCNMHSKSSKIWRAVLREVREVSYVLLALFNLFVAYMTFKRGGGFGDWQAVVVMLVMVLLASLVLWLGLQDRIQRLRNGGA